LIARIPASTVNIIYLDTTTVPATETRVHSQRTGILLVCIAITN
jgi:hypothetical protein